MRFAIAKFLSQIRKNVIGFQNKSLKLLIIIMCFSLIYCPYILLFESNAFGFETVLDPNSPVNGFGEFWPRIICKL